MPIAPTFIESVAEAGPAIAAGDSVAIVQESDEYPGELYFFHMEQESFVRTYGDFVSPFCALSELFMLGPFLDRLAEDEVRVYFLDTTRPIVERYNRWSEPLTVAGMKDISLHAYQQFGIQRALESRIARRKLDGFFFNFGTGTGKSVIAAAGVQELIVNRDEADLCLMFTMRKMKVNMARTVEALTDVEACVVDGSKARREKLYEAIRTADPKERAGSARCVVLNYEKGKHAVDFDAIAKMIEGKRVLWVFDEVQKILRGENNKNLARKGIDELMRSTAKSTAWPMSASIVKSSPLRYHDMFDLISNQNPLGNRTEFEQKYVEKIDHYMIRAGVPGKTYHWNKAALTEVRHRVSLMTQAVRKTDPGVREFFKGMQTVVIPVQQSSQERMLYSLILDDAEEHEQDDDFTITQHYACLRYVCNTPASLLYSESEVAQRIAAHSPNLIDTPSTKFEMICDKIEQIREGGDQVVVFTQWTYLTLFLLAKELHRRGIEYVTHYGTGMTDAKAQEAQDRFKADPDITVFLSSDAGAFGLNFQNARYVINVEAPYDPDILTQRNDRIDRADSYLDGLTAYIYVTDDTVEQNIWRVNEERRRVSAATQGTVETLSRYDSERYATEKAAMRSLIWGSGLTHR